MDNSQEQQKPAKKIDLSLTQVIGGSLAAATAAALGSKIGVAGTIIGAAVVSVISAVAASLYTSSLRRTREAAKAAVEVVRVKRLDGQRPTDIALDRLPTAIVGKVRRRGSDTRAIGLGAAAQTKSDETAVLSASASGPSPDAGERDEPSNDEPAAATTYPPSSESEEVDELQVDVPAGKSRRLRLRPVLIGAGAIFVVAVVGITGYELASGESISGGNRTSLLQIVDGKTTPPTTPVQPSDTGDQAPGSSTTAPQDGTAPAPPTGESSSSQSETTTPSTPSTTTPPTTTEQTTPPDTAQTPPPTENSKPETGPTTPPANPTDAAPPTTP